MYAGAGSCGECAAEQGARCTTHLDLGGVRCRDRGYASTDALSDASRTTPRYSFSSPGFGVAGDAGGGGAGGGGGGAPAASAADMASASRSDSWNARSSSGFVATKCSVRRRRRFVLAASAMFASVPPPRELPQQRFALPPPRVPQQ